MTYTDAAREYGRTMFAADPFMSDACLESLKEGYDAALASVTVRAEPITTAAELAALLPRRVVRDRMGHDWEKGPGYSRPTDGVFRKRDGDRWGTTCAFPEALVKDGPLTLLAPASPPVLLTADDPRWRDGAKVRGEFEDGTAVECIIRNGVAWLGESLFGFGFGDYARVILLAEAPDPDADLVSTLRRILDKGYVVDLAPAPQLLSAIRAAGYVVTKRADA